MCVEIWKSEYLGISCHSETMKSLKLWSNCVTWSHKPLISPGTWGRKLGDLHELEARFINVVSFRLASTTPWDNVSRTEKKHTHKNLQICDVEWSKLLMDSLLPSRVCMNISLPDTWRLSSMWLTWLKTILCWKNLMGVQEENIHEYCRSAP